VKKNVRVTVGEEELEEEKARRILNELTTSAGHMERTTRFNTENRTSGRSRGVSTVEKTEYSKKKL